MGQPGRRYGLSSSFGWKPTRGTETSQYLEEEKSSRDSPSRGDRTGRSPNHGACAVGLWGHGGALSPPDAVLGAEAAWNGPRHEVIVL
jgi:hypothetical protein